MRGGLKVGPAFQPVILEMERIDRPESLSH
jgi:hypothetical protein